jgi:hypothetical protein
MNITLTREEAQQILDALEAYPEEWRTDKEHNAMETFRARLSAPEPEQTRSEKMREAGITRRPKGWSKEDEPEPVADKYLMEVECTKCGAKQDGILTVNVPPQREWQNAALRLGEELSTVGPNGYYNMTAQQWLDWAMKNVTPARISQPYKEQADAVFAETNGRMRIDPVTGNVGIGWASGPEKNGGA